MIISELETKRLKLIPLGIRHITKEYVRWMNDKDVIRFLDSGGDYDLKKLENYIKNAVRLKTLFWAIHVKNSKKHIGNIKIDPIDKKNNYGEYGIMIGDKKSWGKGFGKEASLGVIKYCFEKLKLRKINLGLIDLNINAMKLYLSIGFEVEGVFKKHVLFENNYETSLRMALFNNKLK